MKSIVLDGHTLGVVMGSEIQVLRASVLRGSTAPAVGTIPLPLDVSRIRPATRQDFADFGVVAHDEYFSD